MENIPLRKFFPPIMFYIMHFELYEHFSIFYRNLIPNFLFSIVERIVSCRENKIVFSNL